jgi:tyrosyl-tRNA synthetase
MSDLLTRLTARGMVHDATPGLAARLATGRPVTGYCGFDPTADSLHVGNLVPVMALAWLQRAGGTPVALVGGGTGLIGDPSGKRNERPMLSAETIAANAAAIEAQLRRFLDFDGPAGARLVNNADWLSDATLLDFLRDTGKHFTVNYMLQKDSVRSRMDTGISYTEFSYMLIQAHDFAHLYRTEGCDLQVGGSDQWGNITAGIELIGRRERGEAHGLVVPLLTTASGAKFGKSEDGNVWLDAKKTSPYKFYQFWLNTDDRDVERFLKFFTLLPLDEIAAIMATHTEDPSQRTAQRALATDLTRRVHNQDVDWVIKASDILFGGRNLKDYPEQVFDILRSEVTTVEVPREQLRGPGYSLVDALVATGLASSKAEARRGIDQKAYSIGDEKVDEVERKLTLQDTIFAKYIVLRRGKRHFAIVTILLGLGDD